MANRIKCLIRFIHNCWRQKNLPGNIEYKLKAMARNQFAISTPMCSSDGDDCIAAWDVSTGNMFSTYRSMGKKSAGFVPRHCIDRIGYQYLINGYQNSPLLNVWSLDGKDRLHLKLILPGNVGALCITPDGHYLLTAIDTRLYIWQLASGYLLAVLDGHYQSIRVVKMAGDQTHFITGGDDGVILIWNFAKVIVPDSRQSFSVIDGHSSRLEPDHTITNSSTAIIDIHVGHGGPNTRFVVCAEQSSTVKMYQLSTGILLATISLPALIMAVVMDRMERALFVGSANGPVYEVVLSRIYQQPRRDGDKSLHIDLSCLGGEQECLDTNRNDKQVMIGHTGAVYAMAVTIDGQALLTGSQDRTIRLWHIGSHQCMRTVQCKGPVSNLIVGPSMAGLFLFDSLESCNYSLNTVVDSNSTDPSLSRPNAGQGSGKSKRHKSLHSPLFNSIYSRPHSIEQTLRTLPNPPKPICSSFQRDIFRLRFNPINLTRSYSRGQSRQVEPTDDSGLLNAFDQGGCLWTRNDQTSGVDFWPRWSTFMVPDFDEWHQPDTGLVNTDIHNDHDEKFQVISKLQQANHQLYQYAIEAIFNGQSKERGAIENVECIELDE
ncbi:WD domain containing protein [Euroglyphus maynei]|uniref:WD domain containing protein n=1 Tax=Euroglyphus maynei TaxID=6958 RepID=A0A1Y3AYF5_EURMA|nr:WD domain containing protein [Euroglyphus maynei]